MQPQGIDARAVSDIETGVYIALYQRHLEGKAFEGYFFGLGLVPADVAVKPETEVFDTENLGYSRAVGIAVKVYAVYRFVFARERDSTEGGCGHGSVAIEAYRTGLVSAKRVSVILGRSAILKAVVSSSSLGGKIS